MQSELRQKAETIIGRKLSQPDYDRIKDKAEYKLSWIISHFGDDDGERLGEDYLAQLIAEAYRTEILEISTWIISSTKGLKTRKSSLPESKPLS